MLKNRYRRIVNFFARMLLGFVYWELALPRLGLRNISRSTRPQRLKKSAQDFRGLAVQMGGVLIKVGQFLSTRVDVLPREFTEELAGLQDEVPPERFEDIRQVAEAEYGMRLEEKFASFDSQPLAAASLGQVHRAVVADKTSDIENTGTPEKRAPLRVVVKIQRPNIENLIATDLAALRTVGKWLQRYRPISRRANVSALLEEFTRILYEEIDYLAEGRNAETFAANFSGDPGVRVPAVVWSHTTRRALTLQDVYAIKITDYAAITAAGIDRAEVANRLLDAYLRQIFEDGFFHADPHPGNLFVQPGCLGNGFHAESAAPAAVSAAGDGHPAPAWQLTFVDFGMVGRVPAITRQALREMLIGVGTQDAARVVKSYQMLDILLPGADLQMLEKAEAKAFERFWGKSMKELQQISTSEVREFAAEFSELVYSMPFQVPQDFIFLARAVGILSGMCTGLDPQFNVWAHLAPYAEKLIAEEAQAPRGFWLDEARNVARSLLGVPLKMDRLLQKIERGDVSVRSPEISRQVSRLEGGLRQLVWAVLLMAFLLGGIQLWLAGETAFAALLLGLAGLSLAVVLFQALRRPRG